MRRGLLLLVTVALGAVVLAACLPPPPPPAPSTPTTTRAVADDHAAVQHDLQHDDHEHDDHDHHDRAAERWRRGPRTVRSGAATCSRPTTRGTATSRRSPSTPTRPTTSPRSPRCGGNQKLHADFGGGGAYGIPYITVPGTQPTRAGRLRRRTATRATPGRTRSRSPHRSRAASDAPRARGRPRPLQALRAVRARAAGTSRWSADSGAVFDLTSNALRPEGWTSADAAGLPIFPGLVRYDEVASGHIDHALRFTVSKSQQAYLHPATHWRVVEHRPQPPADGAAAAAEGELQRVGVTPARRASCSTR